MSPWACNPAPTSPSWSTPSAVTSPPTFRSRSGPASARTAASRSCWATAAPGSSWAHFRAASSSCAPVNSGTSRNSFRRPTMLALTTLALVAALQGGQQSQDFHWTGTLAAGKTLSIKNINGDISAVAASGNQIEVTGIKTARRGSPDNVQVKVEQTADGVVICTIYPNQQGSSCDSRHSNGRSNDRDDVSVDFTVHLPASVRLAAHSVNGDVSAKGLKGDADLGTVNGDANVETSGFAEASTVNLSLIHISEPTRLLSISYAV